MTPRARLFKQNTYRTIYVWIGRTFAVIKIVVAFTSVVHRANFIQGFCMKLSNFSRQFLVFLRRVWVHTSRLARHEEESRIASHFVMIGQNVGFPLVIELYTGLRFGLLRHQPITIEVEPIMIGASVGPNLAELTRGRVAHQILPFVHVYPLTKPLQTIGIEGRVE